MKAILAVDLGTGGPKVALVSTAGAILDDDFAPVRLLLSPGGAAEQDPEEWWQAITGCSRRLMERGSVPASDVVAVSVTAQWMGTVAVDESGRHLMNALIWMDSRGSEESRRLTGGGVEVPGTGYNAYRLWRWLRHTGGLPSRTGKDPVGHIRWIRRHRPEVYDAARTFLEPVDYLGLRLTGRTAASYDSITGYWCTDSRDLGRVGYVDSLVRQCGLERSKLPELLPTGAVLGDVSAEAATALGITTAAKVVMGTGDTASAAIGAGAVRDFDAHLYVGTSSWLSCHVPFRRTDIRTNITSLPSGIPGRYWVATEQEAAGKCLTWLVESVLFAGDALGGEGAPGDVLDRLNRLAADAEPGSGGILFIPWLNGERTPVDDHLLRGGWFNVALTADRGALVRAVFEGVALNTRWMLGAAERFVHRELPHGFEAVRFVGGGACSALWCQIMADVLDRPILQMARPTLANVRGAALCAAVALGECRWEDVPGLVEIEATYQPQQRNRAVYDRLFAAFTDFHRRNRRLYARLNEETPSWQQSRRHRAYSATGSASGR